MQNSKLKLKVKRSGSVVMPLLIGLGVVAVVLGIFVVVGRRNEEGKFKLPFGQGKPEITVLPTQTMVAGKQKFFLEISSPADGVTINKDKVTIIGKTVPGADVSVNETELTAEIDGKFSTTVSLEEGENPILITAGNEEGFEEKEITVSFEK